MALFYAQGKGSAAGLVAAALLRLRPGPRQIRLPEISREITKPRIDLLPLWDVL
jgi:hypothetical protein